jgi:acetyltransferase-like isoleucine patch superfamily enzyme
MLAVLVIVCFVELTQPELQKLVAVAKRRLTQRASIAKRALRRFGVRLGGDDENDRLTAMASLHAGGLLTVGRYTYGVPTVLVFGPNPPRLDIGAFCSISDGVEIMLNGNHRVDWSSTYPFRHQFGMPGRFADGHPASRGPVAVGNDVWLARDALVLSGVTIGDGAVVGARAVVTRDVAPYSIVAGNPARHVRVRFNEDVIGALMRLKWWDWPDEKIRANVAALCDANVEAFLKTHAAPSR